MNTLTTSKLISSASWLLLLGSMMVLAVVGYQVFQRHINVEPPQKFSFSDSQVGRNMEKADLAAVAQSHIFGVVPIKVTKVETPKVVEAPKTDLNLSLTGVITAVPAEESRAMIEVQRGTTSIVRVGEVIGETGTRLESVFTDHILINRQGKIEKLLIDRETLTISNLSNEEGQTISSLNINVSEFEALAKVDPADLNIDLLLPKTDITEQPANPTAIQNFDQAALQESAALLEQLKQLEELEQLEEEEQRLRELENEESGEPLSEQQ